MWWWFCNSFLCVFAVDNLSSLSGMNKVFCVVALLDQLMRVYSFFQAWLIPRWCTATCPKTLGYHTFTEGLWLWGDSPLSAKPCRPKLRSHKLSICPPCGTVLIGVMRDDLNLHPAFKWTWFPFCNCSRYLWSSVINVCSCLLSEGGFFLLFFRNSPVFRSVAMLYVCGRNMTAPFRNFRVEHYLRCFDWLKLLQWCSPELSILVAHLKPSIPMASYSFTEGEKNNLVWRLEGSLPSPRHVGLIHSTRQTKMNVLGRLEVRDKFQAAAAGLPASHRLFVECDFMDVL